MGGIPSPVSMPISGRVRAASTSAVCIVVQVNTNFQFSTLTLVSRLPLVTCADYSELEYAQLSYLQ